MKKTTYGALGLVGATLFLGFGCSGGQAPASPTGTAAPTRTAARSSSPGVHATDVIPYPLTGYPSISNGTCPVGHGDINATCSKGGGQFLAQVEGVIAQLVQERPDLFDLNRYMGEGGYYVHDSDMVNYAVVSRLQALGLCAFFDFTRQVVQVKSSDAGSEDYQVVNDKSFLVRGQGSLVASCTPASFPLTAADQIAYVRVGFYSIFCDDGVPLGGNVKAQIPMGCYAIVTATPKKADGTDVDPRVHGSEVTWTVIQNGTWIDLRDYPDQPFNKYVKGLDPGEFAICATVQGKQGCMQGDVIP